MLFLKKDGASFIKRCTICLGEIPRHYRMINLATCGSSLPSILTT